jgi:hypothetical protein
VPSISFARNVSRDGKNPICRQAARNFFERAFSTRNYRDACAFTRKQLRCRTANAAGCASNENALSFGYQLSPASA